MWEGVWPASFVMELRSSPEFMQLVGERVNEPYALKLVETIRKDKQAGYAVNCWHKNEVESVAMWKLYTSGEDGVAIQTTVGSLKSCLAQEPRNLFIVEVEYSDHDFGPPAGSSDSLVPLTTKRRSFRHESEVRILLDRGSGRDLTIASWVSGEANKGESLAVNCATLIEKVVVSPAFPTWAIKSLQSRLEEGRIPVKIQTSDLLRLPNPELMYHNLRMSRTGKL